MGDEPIKKIGLLGGTFDPIHFAHLNLAMELMEQKNLDEVWFIPARINPLKNSTLPTASDAHRLAMLKLALEDYPHFLINDLELQREPPSFTVDTIRAILTKESGNHSLKEFYWLMGEDGIYSFEYWYQPEEIVRLIPILIGTRSVEKALRVPVSNIILKKALREGLTKIPLMDISSTKLRERLSKGLNCHHLIPSSVLSYIKQNQLYK
jgi:nicotinate-nucleotide adenylyltransferase